MRYRCNSSHQTIAEWPYIMIDILQARHDGYYVQNVSVRITMHVTKSRRFISSNQFNRSRTRPCDVDCPVRERHRLLLLDHGLLGLSVVIIIRILGAFMERSDLPHRISHPLHSRLFVDSFSVLPQRWSGVDRHPASGLIAAAFDRLFRLDGIVLWSGLDIKV